MNQLAAQNPQFHIGEALYTHTCARACTHTHTHTRYKMAQGKNKHNPWKRQSPLGLGMLLQKKWLRNPFPPCLCTSYAVFPFLSNIALTLKQRNTGSEKRLPILACVSFAWNAVINPHCASPSSLWPWKAALFSFP